MASGTRTTLATLVVGVLLGAVLTGPASRADWDPPAGTPATVTGDPLPTVQVDGVVWQQAIVGTTVYAVGSFTHARPAGAAPGTQETPRANILAYSLTTGALQPFAHELNGQARAVTASPDGRRLYVGGDFTTVDGKQRGHLAAFDLPSGALSTSFHPGVSGTVHALTATDSRVYVGGSFGRASTLPRSNLAAYNVNGVLSGKWKAAADRPVRSMVLAPGGARLVIGGQFKQVNGVGRLGIAGVDTTTGATVKPWRTGATLSAAGSGAWISSLTTDETLIYGTAVQTRRGDSVGNFEGSFAVDPVDGRVILANDCLGDSYGNATMNGVLYVVSHAHDCSSIGEFAEATPKRWYRATAFTTEARGVNTGPDRYGWDFSGVPRSQLLHWLPDLPPGTFTGQEQAAWSVAARSGYVVLGGEFTTVNGTPQQGLVRFATAATAPRQLGPVQSLMVAPTVTPLPLGGARVAWTSTWDRDNARLRHEVVRDGVVVHEVSVDAVGWRRPTLTFDDTGAPPGEHTYRIRTYDPAGNKVASPDSTITTTSANLAYHASASQGASYKPGSFPASRAVDGNTDGRIVTHTNKRPHAWWKADLGRSQALARLVLWNRTDCCSERLSNFWVFVSDAPFDTSLTPAQQAKEDGVWSRHATSRPNPRRDVPLPAGTTGRYVMVQLDGTGFLSLAEVQAYAPA